MASEALRYRQIRLDDTFELANCFVDLQPPGSGIYIPIILRHPIPSHSLLELTLNYGAEYWTPERLHWLPLASDGKCLRLLPAVVTV